MVFGGCLNWRVRHCSYSRRRPSWEVKRSTVSRPPPVSRPMVRIMSRVSVMLWVMRWYLPLSVGSRTWPRPQSKGECKSARPEEIAARR
jgi:hypothetical protein